MIIRIEKHLSEQGIMSRREAKRFLQEGLIFVNKKKASQVTRLIPQQTRLATKNQ